jgi:hypothetical protein
MGNTLIFFVQQYIIVELAVGGQVEPVAKENVITVYFQKGNYERAQCLLPDGIIYGLFRSLRSSVL